MRDSNLDFLDPAACVAFDSIKLPAGRFTSVSSVYSFSKVEIFRDKQIDISCSVPSFDHRNQSFLKEERKEIEKKSVL